MKIKIAPSILSADFSNLKSELRRMERAGADLFHVDVMDCHFVPNITIGPVVVEYLRKSTRLALDVHLMIEQPEKYIDSFAAAGSDMITVHEEVVSLKSFKKMSARLRRKGIKFGISLNPPTPAKRIDKFLPFADFVLVMSVNPGFGGQKFIPSAIPKVVYLRSKFCGDISVDGGVNEKVAAQLIDAGANILVSGSYLFKSKKPKFTIERMRHARK
ncbi:MAG: ribulose-phosphate 3-epimerase [Candidatus Omnitrophica bacterium]|nr:ribulose-phosphate 3-epimerase [Candidatus Omnitrophota bacterium]